MPSHRGRQKSLEKKKKQRVAARNATASGSPSRSATLRLAASCPFGPAFMTGNWRLDDEEEPGLVSAILTRALPDGTFLAASCLLDRTCLGVKDAFAKGPLTRDELGGLVDRYEEAHGDGIAEVSVLEAQSVIFHALDYAGLIGFSPHRDFDAALVGPRPETLLDTPLAHPSHPRYVAGPYDDVARITRVLTKYRAERALPGRQAGIEGLLRGRDLAASLP
jgi:hypothetical protein